MNASLRQNVFRLHEQVTGRQILKRLEDLNQTQWLSRDELLELQRNKLLRLMEYANQYVPYYQRIFREVGFQPDELRRDLANLDKVPILTKAIIRSNWDDMLTIEPERRSRLSRLSTSGSTGEPLFFMQDRDFRDAVTADIQRHLGWGDCKLGGLHAVIWGASFKPTSQYKLRTRLIDKIWNRFQINAFQMTEESMKAFAERIIRQKPGVLFGYATSVYRFAQYVRRSGTMGITFDGVFTSAETLLPPMREFIEETFQCKVFNRYASLELGGIACECEEHKGLHISAENNYVEIVQNGSPAAPNEIGDLIVTNLNNFGMPFIRYSVGDTGAWSKQNQCECGRESPMLSSLEGRIIETFWTQDGRIAWSGFAGSAFRCLTHPSIRQFQVVQKSLERMVIRLARVGEIPQMTLEEIKNAVHLTFGGSIVVEFEFPDEIPPLSSGKHAYAISELNRN